MTRCSHMRFVAAALCLLASLSFAGPLNILGGGRHTPEEDPGGGDSLLEQACAALDAGDSASFAAGEQSAFSVADLSWETSFYHDDIHGVAHLMAKPAGQEQAWKHEIYDIATSTWTVFDDGMFDAQGHIYGNFSMDHTTGDLWLTVGDWGLGSEKRPYRFTQSSQTWALFGNVYTGGTESHMNGVVYHPNLYGSGDGGVVVLQQNSSSSMALFWRLSTGVVQTAGSDYAGEKEGGGVYLPGLDAVFIGASAPNGELIKVTPHATPGSTPVLTAMGQPPIRVQGAAHGFPGANAGFGSLHVHPSDPDLLLLMETDGQRAYTSPDGDNWTQLADHPITEKPRVMAQLRGTSCMWAVGRNDADEQDFSIVYRPPLP
jgi:hypothetical protein